MRRKIKVEELAIGMYVAELDKPWEQSSFLFQGFEIETEEDLAKLKTECRMVVIEETEASKAAVVRAAAARPAVPSASTTITSRSAPEPAGFKRELKEVVQAQTVARTNITRVMEDVRMGKSLDTKDTKAAVTTMVGAISSNPNSMLWLANLRQTHERTAGHCLNTSILCIAFGKSMGLSDVDLNLLGQGAMLHDIGKVRIPRAILDKPGSFTEEERQLVRKHPVDGEAVLKLTRQLPDKVLEIVRSHHERLDGKGYPDGLAGDAVPLGAKIVGIVDTYDSLTSDSPHRPASTAADALRVLRTEGAEAYGKDMIQEFIRCLGIYPIGSLVECNNGALAVVVSSTQASRLKPVIMVVRDERGTETKPRMLLSLATMGDDLVSRWGIKGNADPKKHNLNLPGIIAEEAGA
ncbi:MAG TPA: HD-GYP domain-containing protein [Gammaproteobacteria bacterium]|jgi:putative nucleotidyltransferase with HDIG domain|nr:HD-GYP domain-containing protein [Gammaproteobacteria bacterium]